MAPIQTVQDSSNDKPKKSRMRAQLSKSTTASIANTTRRRSGSGNVESSGRYMSSIRLIVAMRTNLRV